MQIDGYQRTVSDVSICRVSFVLTITIEMKGHGINEVIKLY